MLYVSGNLYKTIAMKQFALVLLTLLALPIAAQVNVLDPTFGSNGVVDIFTLSTPTNFAIHPSGKIVLAGTTDTIAIHNGGYLKNGVCATVIRLNNDGTVDTTLGFNGYLALDFDTLLFPNTTVQYQSRAINIFTQNDGKILLNFYFFLNPATAYYYTARLKETGDLDTTFGQNGMIQTGPVTQFYELSNGGHLYIDNNSLRLYTANGQTESAFGNSGVVAIDSVDNIISIEELNGGYSIIATTMSAQSTSLQRFTVSSTGMVSPIQTTLIYSFKALFNSLAIDNNNNTYVSGYAYTNSVQQYGTIVKLKPDFTIDTDFALYGRFKETIPSVFNNIYIQQDGNLLTAGARRADSLNLSLNRVTTAGIFDVGFGNNGCIESTETNTADYNYNTIAIQSEQQADGKIVSCIKKFNSIHIERFSLSAVNAVEEHATAAAILYPNPALPGAVLTFSTKEKNVSLRVLDMQGRLISSTAGNQIIAPAANGMYVVQIISPAGVSSQKLIVKD